MLLRLHGDCTSGSPLKKSCGGCSEAQSAALVAVVAQQPYPGRSCQSPLTAQE